MILIVDNTRRKTISKIKEDLLRDGIPCAVADVEGIMELLPASFVIVSEPHLLLDVQYMCSLNMSTSPVLCEEDDNIAELARSLFDRVAVVYEDPYSPIYRSSENDGYVIYSKTIHFTKTEKLIITMLLLGKGWYTPECIADYCKKESRNAVKSICVHICNINKKTRAAVGRELIECRRYKGYRICDL